MEENDSGQEQLFSMDDIKLEVMRARGAGGQVNQVCHHDRSHSLSCPACEQNRISSPINTHPLRDHCFYARRTKSASSQHSDSFI